APWGDHPHLGRERLVGQLEPHLVVALARAAVGQGVRARSERHLHLPLGQHRARQRRAEQILAFVDRARLDSFPEIRGDELLAQVFDMDLRGARRERFLTHRLEIVALADVAHHGDDLASVILAQPRNDDRSVESARVRQDHSLYVGHDFSFAGEAAVSSQSSVISLKSNEQLLSSTPLSTFNSWLWTVLTEN